MIKVTVVFLYDNGVKQLEEREIEGAATIDGLNAFCIEQIKDAMRGGAEDKYLTTEFLIECLGA